MARKKKAGKMISYYIDKRLVATLDKYADETGYSKTVIIEKALQSYFEDKNIKIEEDIESEQ